MSEEKMINDAVLETIAGGAVYAVRRINNKWALVRNEPGRSGSVIGKIGPGTIVNVTGGRVVYKNGLRWLEITFEGGKGWVESNMLYMKK